MRKTRMRVRQENEPSSFFRRLLRWIWAPIAGAVVEQPAVVVGAFMALLRASGKTVVTGQTGLKFSFGRATRVLEPGFHPLIPFLQKVRVLPTRSRTLELEDQRVATLDGLVFVVRATLVWRVVDVRRALIMIDELEQGMRQVLVLSVQELLREATRATLRDRENLDTELERRMAERLRVWGVEVERAGFPSITPSERSLRITQLEKRLAARRQALALFELPTELAITLLGTRTMPRRRGLRARRREAAARRRQALKRVPKRLRAPDESEKKRTVEREAERAGQRVADAQAPLGDKEL